MTRAIEAETSEEKQTIINHLSEVAGTVQVGAGDDDCYYLDPDLERSDRYVINRLPYWAEFVFSNSAGLYDARVYVTIDLDEWRSHRDDRDVIRDTVATLIETGSHSIDRRNRRNLSVRYSTTSGKYRVHLPPRLGDDLTQNVVENLERELPTRFAVSTFEDHDRVQLSVLNCQE